MRAPWVLLKHSLHRVRTLVLIMGLVLAVFQVFLIVVAKSLQQSRAFDQISALMPPFVRELMGPSFAGFLSFSGIVCLGYFHVAVMGSLVGVVMSLATMPASEIEIGLMDLILSRPLARHWIITRTILVVILATLFLLGLMVIGTWIGLRGLAPAEVEWPSAHLVLSLVVNLGLLMACWSGVAMAIGSVSRRRSVAGAVAGLLALVTFLLDYVARAWRPAESIAWLSPFKYYSPFDLLMGNPLPPRNLWVLAAIAISGFALSYIFFSKRDICH